MVQFVADCDGKTVFHLDCASRILNEFVERRKQDLSKNERKSLGERTLYRCLITFLATKSTLKMHDCVFTPHDFIAVNLAIKDAGIGGQVATIDTNLFSVVQNVGKLKQLTQANMIILRKPTAELEFIELAMEDNEVIRFKLCNRRIAQDDKLSELLCDLPAVREITLERCVLSENFKPSFKSKHLSHLYLSGNTFDGGENMMRVLASSVSSLVSLDLSHCDLNQKCLPAMKTLFRHNPAITYLNLADNNFSQQENTLLRTIGSLGHLESLHLYHCMLTRNCGSGFSGMAIGASKLRILNVNFNNFAGNPEVLMGLSGCKSLEELYMYSCEIQTRNCSSLKQVVMRNDLTVLDLSYNDLGDGTQILEALTVCSSLEKVSFFNCALVDTCLHSLADFLKSNKKISDLNVSRNHFWDGKGLFGALKNAKKLEKLYARDVGLYPEESQEEFNLFVKCTPKLRILELAENQLSQGLIKLMTMWRNLEKVYLYECGINDQCVEHLKSMLVNNRNIEVLDLERNDFVRSRELLLMLEEVCLVGIDLRLSSIGDAKVAQVARMIRQCKKLDHIWITENNFTVDGFNGILRALGFERVVRNKYEFLEVVNQVTDRRRRPFIH